ncbi:patatin-like phospholipase family protein [Reichenbachiella agarivorans]|uniref:Patatin-like phospholipase family protein n=1 Tax=Reichenbachiella agarivorans TaxID=2979464 RepID=A0ABY6CMA3_9BACT|nr:patatin-like phospholipase family protein [Reichenbachiella agarivorans]UXP31644.1 patatin-like phospholipase family protein [Reichenbachiella agarivorans]
MNPLKRILSIDGGGIRGIIPGQIIVEIEKEFRIQVSDYFDLVAGTSTGGILACAYLCPDGKSKKPKFSAEQVVDLYFDRGDEIFDIPTFHKIKTMGGILDEKYPADGIEDALKDYFGDVWLSNLLKPTVITSYDIKNRKGHFFYQHKAVADEYNFKVKDVCRATSAAPTYFECEKVTSKSGEDYPLIDGGVFVNNPALVAYAEGRELFDINKRKAKAEDMKILSLGTGYTHKTYHYSKARNYGMAEWVQPIIDIMMSGSAEVADYQLRKIYDTTPQPKQYLRLDGDLKGSSVDPEMDCATHQNMKALKEYGQQLFKDNKDALAEWLGL